MNEKCNYSLKLVLLGDASGKEALFNRIIYGYPDAKMTRAFNLKFESVILSLPENIKARLQVWDIPEPETSNVRISGASIICIVLDAANDRQGELSKIAQVRQYKKQIDAAIATKGIVLVIDNQNDSSAAIRMRDEELSQLELLGIARSHYIYASAISNQANDETIIKCLERYVQEYIDANSSALSNTNYEPLNSLPAGSQSAPLTFLSVDWWGSLFSSSQQPHVFNGTNRIRQQIVQLSDKDAIAILIETHRHLMKGSSSEARKEPFELSRGGGKDTLSFIDKSTRQEITIKYKYSFPHHVIQWLSICVPYAHYKQQLAEEYVLSSRYDLLRLFNSIVMMTSNLKPYCRRYPSTEEFYRQLENFLINQISQHNNPAVNELTPSSSAAVAAASVR